MSTPNDPTNTEQLFLSKKDEQENVQRKTFTNWMNIYLLRLKPPIKVKELFEDLKTGVHLIQLLQVLSGEKLAIEHPRKMTRVHHLSNIRTALEYLESRKIKMVNINPTDIADGKPPIVLGLMWTIILHFQIEEQEEQLMSALGEGHDGANMKGSAKKALLAWIDKTINQKYDDINIKDFGKGWSDGRGFNALVHNIDPSLVDMDSLKGKSNHENLAEAFRLAEEHLGIPHLLDAEDVDVEKPDDKSIMTYVAQFLQAYPEGGKNLEKTVKVDPEKLAFDNERSDFEALKKFLEESKIKIPPSGSVIKDFSEESKLMADFLNEETAQRAKLEELRKLRAEGKLRALDPGELDPVEEAWKEMERRAQEWRWRMDAAVPGAPGQVTKWLARAERCLVEDWPGGMLEELMATLGERLDQHNEIFTEMEPMCKLFKRLKDENKLTELSPEHEADINRRLDSLKVREPPIRRKLEYLEGRYRLAHELEMFLDLLANWSPPYGKAKEIEKTLKEFQTEVVDGKIANKLTKSIYEVDQKADLYKSRDLKKDSSGAEEVDRVLEDIKTKWSKSSKQIDKIGDGMKKALQEWCDFEKVFDKLETWLKGATVSMSGSPEERSRTLKESSKMTPTIAELKKRGTSVIQQSRKEVGQEVQKRLDQLLEQYDKLVPNLEEAVAEDTSAAEAIVLAEKAARVAKGRSELDQGQVHVIDWLDEVEALLSKRVKGDPQIVTQLIKYLTEHLEEADTIDSNLKQLMKTAEALAKDSGASTKDLDQLKELKSRLTAIQKSCPEQLKVLKSILSDLMQLEDGIENIRDWVEGGEELVNALRQEGHPQQAKLLRKEIDVHFVDVKTRKDSLNGKIKLLKKIIASGEKTVDASDLETAVSDLSERFEVLSKYFDKQNAEENEYKQLFEKTDVWMEDVGKKVGMLGDFTGNKDALKKRLNQVKELKSRAEDGDAILKATILAGKKVGDSEGPGMMKSVQDELGGLEDKRQDIHDRLEEIEHGLEDGIVQLDHADEVQASLMAWLKEKETLLGNVKSANSLDEKKGQLELLEAALEELVDKEGSFKEFCTALPKGSERKGDEVMQRYQKVLKQYQDAVGKCTADVHSHEDYDQKLFALHEWLDPIKASRKEIDSECSGPEGLANKLTHITNILAQRPEGESLLRDLTAAIDKLASTTGQEGRDKMRQDLRQVQSEMEAIFKNLDASKREVETTSGELGRLEGGLTDLIDWIESGEELVDALNKEQDAAQARLIRQEQKKQFEELKIQKNSLDDKVRQLKKILSSGSKFLNTQELEDKINELNDRLIGLSNYASEYDSKEKEYKLAFQKAESWLIDMAKRVNGLADISGNREAIKKKLEQIKELKSRCSEGDQLLQAAIVSGKKAGDIGGPGTQKGVQEELEALENMRHDIHDQLEKFNLGLEEGIVQWNHADKKQSDLNGLLNSMESSLNGVKMGDTLDEKKVQLKKIENILEEMIQKEGDIKDYIEALPKGSEKKGEEMMQRYKKMLGQVQNSVNKWSADVDDHQLYRDKLSALLQWMDPVKKTREEIDVQCSDPQQLSNKLALIADLVAKRPEGESLLREVSACVEKLAASTGPEGRENMRQDLRQVQADMEAIFRDLEDSKRRVETTSGELERLEGGLTDLIDWIESGEELVHALNKEQDATQARLVRQEQRMHFEEVKERRGSLEERAKQLKKIMTSGSNFVNTKQIEDNLSNLNDRFNDLSDYATQQTANEKEYQQAFQKSEAWLNDMVKKVDKLDELFGDKDAIKKRLIQIKELRSRTAEGDQIISGAMLSGKKVGDRGGPGTRKGVQEELGGLEDKRQDIYDRLDDICRGLEERIVQWDRADERQDVLTAWLKQQEGQLSNFKTGNTLEEKQNQLEKFQDLLEQVSRKEGDFDNFLKSLPKGSERKGEELTQRYRKLANQIEDTVNKCSTDVLEHQKYRDKLSAILDWLEPVKESRDKIDTRSCSPDDLNIKLGLIADLVTQRPQGEAQLRELSSSVEKLAASTGAEGREIMRQDLRQIQNEMETIFRDLEDSKRRFETTLGDFASAENQAAQLSRWIDEAERQLAECEARGGSLEEKKALADRLRSLMRDLEVRSSGVNELVEKSRGLTSGTPNPDLADHVEDIEARFDRLVGAVTRAAKESEQGIKAHEEFMKDAGKFSDWLGKATNQITTCSDTKGDRATLEARLAKMKRVKDEIAIRREELQRLKELARSLQQEGFDPTIDAKISKLTQEYDELSRTSEVLEEDLKNAVRDQGTYEKAYDDAILWIERITQKLLLCSDYTGKPEELQEKLVKIQEIRSAMPQGEEHFQTVNRLGDQVLRSMGPGRDSDRVHRQLTQMEDDWSELRRQLEVANQILEKALAKWADYERLREELLHWLEEAERSVDQALRAGLGDGASVQFKNLQTEVQRQDLEFRRLGMICDEILAIAARPELDQESKVIQERFKRFQDRVNGQVNSFEKAEEEHQAYRDALDEAEQWILQTSFKLMQESSLQCTTLEVTRQTLEEHISLIRDIEEYARTVSNVEVLGGQIIDRIRSQSPEDVAEIKAQLSALRDSYQALRTTADQVKTRLEDNLKKWTVYRDSLSAAESFICNDLMLWWAVHQQPVADSLEDLIAKVTETKQFSATINTMAEDIAIAAHRCEAASFGPTRTTPSLKQRFSQLPGQGQTQGGAPACNEEAAIFSNPLNRLAGQSLCDSPQTRQAEKLAGLMENELKKLEARLNGLEECRNKWEAFVKSRDEFRVWLNEKQRIAGQLYEAGKNSEDIDKIKLEEFLKDVQSKKMPLKEISLTYQELTKHKSDLFDRTLCQIRVDYEALLGRIENRLRMHDKAVEVPSKEKSSPILAHGTQTLSNRQTQTHVRLGPRIPLPLPPAPPPPLKLAWPYCTCDLIEMESHHHCGPERFSTARHNHQHYDLMHGPILERPLFSMIDSYDPNLELLRRELQHTSSQRLPPKAPPRSRSKSPSLEKQFSSIRKNIEEIKRDFPITYGRPKSAASIRLNSPSANSGPPNTPFVPPRGPRIGPLPFSTETMNVAHNHRCRTPSPDRHYMEVRSLDPGSDADDVEVSMLINRHEARGRSRSRQRHQSPDSINNIDRTSTNQNPGEYYDRHMTEDRELLENNGNLRRPARKGRSKQNARVTQCLNQAARSMKDIRMSAERIEYINQL